MNMLRRGDNMKRRVMSINEIRKESIYFQMTQDLSAVFVVDVENRTVLMYEIILAFFQLILKYGFV